VVLADEFIKTARAKADRQRLSSLEESRSVFGEEVRHAGL